MAHTAYLFVKSSIRVSRCGEVPRVSTTPMVMIRFLIAFVLIVGLGIGGFSLWMGSGSGEVIELTDEELSAAQESGEAARDIAVEAEEGEAPLPSLDDLKEIARREEMVAVAGRVTEARDGAADAEERGLLALILAETQRYLGDHDAALALAEEGVAALPSNSRAHHILGKALLGRMMVKARSGGAGAVLSSIGDVRRYIAELEIAIELDPSNVDARVGLIATLAYAPWPVGDKKRARALIEEVGEYDPFRRDFWRAQLLVADEKKRDEAIAAFEALREQNAGDPDVLYTLGDLYAKSENYQLAASTFDSMVDRPHTVHSYRALYQAAKARELGEFELEEAFGMLEEFVSERPVGEMMIDDERVEHHAAMILVKLGRPVEARVRVEKALKVIPDSKRLKATLKTLEEVTQVGPGEGPDGSMSPAAGTAEADPEDAANG